MDKDEIDVVLCTPDAITELIPIRSQLRDKFPTKAKGAPYFFSSFFLFSCAWRFLLWSLQNLRLKIVSLSFRL